MAGLLFRELLAPWWAGHGITSLNSILLRGSALVQGLQSIELVNVLQCSAVLCSIVQMCSLTLQRSAMLSSLVQFSTGQGSVGIKALGLFMLCLVRGSR